VRIHTAQVREILLEPEGLAAWIECPQAALPIAGQYLLAHDPADWAAPLGTSLFPAALAQGAFLAASPVPPGWAPGMRLKLRGPLGQGFTLPSTARRVLLVGLGEHISRLMPLVQLALAQSAALALAADTPLPHLPAAVEAHPLEALEELLPWADYLAIDLPLHKLPELRSLLGESARLVEMAQALVYIPMPCAGIGECGVCAVPSQRGWKLACSDGPVFNLKEIL
jgi:hypothetical protein